MKIESGELMALRQEVKLLQHKNKLLKKENKRLKLTMESLLRNMKLGDIYSRLMAICQVSK